MSPLIGGALIGAGSSILGGLMGRDSASSQQRRAIDLQREFAQHGIQWKVEDAQRAGVHPVYALGASTSGPSIPVMEDPLGRSISEAGQSIARSVAAQESPEQRAQRHVALQLANATYAKDMAQADYYASLASRARQEARAAPGMPAADPNLFVDPAAAAQVIGGAGANRVKLQPSEVTSYAGSDDSVAAGRDVLWKKFKVGGRDWYLPNASSAGEALESVSESWPLMFFVIRENMQRNPNFIRENAHLVPYGREALNASDLVSAAADAAARGRRAREAGGLGDPGNREWRGRAMFRSFR